MKKEISDEELMRRALESIRAGAGDPFYIASAALNQIDQRREQNEGRSVA